MVSPGWHTEGKIQPGRGWKPFLSPRQQTLLLALLLLVMTAALYYPVHSYPFISLDDGLYVTLNPHIQGILGWSTVKWALFHSYLYNWHPLTWLSHTLDVQMFQLEAGRHHEVNVLLHALNALLLFWVLKRATGFTGRSFMVAALFALHPINVESVVWIAERKTVLSATFFLLALGAYRWYALRPRLHRMAVVAFLYGLGLMAKPQVITLPFALLLWDYWPLRRMFATKVEPSSGSPVIPPRTLFALVLEKIPLFAISAVDALITLVAQHVGPPHTWPYTFSVRVQNAIVAYARYVGKAIWPAGLALPYVHPGNSLRWWQVTTALLVLLAISALVAWGRHRRYLVVGWLWFLGILVPMSGMVGLEELAMADRYAYVSFVGLFLMACWGVSDWAEQWHLPPAFLPAVSIATLLVCTVLTHRQIGYWQDDFTLWSHTLQVDPRNWTADAHLAGALNQQGKRDEALAHYYRAAAEMPGRQVNVYLSIALGESQRGTRRQPHRILQEGAGSYGGSGNQGTGAQKYGLSLFDLGRQGARPGMFHRRREPASCRRRLAGRLVASCRSYNSAIHPPSDSWD